MKRVWVVSDLQCPYHDRRAVDALATCISDMKGPDDIVLTIGDEIDLDQISRWDTYGREWSRTIGKDRDLTVQVLKDLQVTDTVRSNHTDRIYRKLASSAPGLIGLPELEIENFLRLPELGIRFHKAFKVAPGWLALHGDESGISPLAGRTAANLAAKVGVRGGVVQGHTHRLGLAPTSHGIYGDISTVWGFEVGTLMDMKSSGAAYSRIHNWQQGFGLLYVDGKTVIPQPVPIVNRSFVVEGVQYKW